MAELSWDRPRPLAEVRAGDIARGGVVFEHRGYLYAGTGQQVGGGGMGGAYELMRRPAGDRQAIEAVVGKVFHEEYLYQLRSDPITRADHQIVLRSLGRIGSLEHPGLLPIYISAAIADNHLCVTPRLDTTLAEVVAQEDLSPRRRVELFLHSLRALAAMHDAGMIHRDVTLRNVLVDRARERSYLFDFDLTLHQDELAGASYKDRYQGRIFGSPGYSVAPELLDPALMETPIGRPADIYAAGSAIFNLFTDELPYGPTEDMWGLLLRIAEGLVVANVSHVVYPSAVPEALRPIIDRCLERNPRDRYPSMNEVVRALEAVLPELDSGETPVRARPPRTLRYGRSGPEERLRQVIAGRRDSAISEALIRHIDGALAKHGYEVQRSLGEVKGYPIVLAAPIPELVAVGRFPDPNTYPKIVTTVDLRGRGDREELVDLWLGGYLPILRAARQGLLTTLHRAVHDDEAGLLLLFSEYVDDARFGTDLSDLDLTLQEALGLGYLVAGQVRRLHRRGMAHNNISERALLLKGVRVQRIVRPAMVGIVAPSLDPEHIVRDVRQLADVIAGWIRQTRIDTADEAARARLIDLWTRLKEVIHDPGLEPPTISELVELMADGLSALDFNFGVLRENGGDLQSYVLLLLSQRLYPRLWPGS